MTTQPFIVNQPPIFTRVGGVITAVQLNGQKIFTRMTEIKIDNNGSNPTQGTLAEKIAIIGTIDATSTEFDQVCNAVSGMVAGDTRTLEITGTDNGTTFSVTSVFVDPPPGGRVAHNTGLPATQG